MSIRPYYAVVLSLLVTGTALAQDPTVDTGGGPSRVFGRPKQLAISSDAALVVEHSTHDVTTVTVSPAVDYFLIPNLSIGGALLLEYQSAGSEDSTRFGIGPRVGYNIPFTDMVGIWPKIGFSYSHNSRSSSTETGNTEISNSRTSNAFTLNLFAPIMFHPVTHFFLGFGPFLDTDLSGSDKITTYGGKLTMGGWFDL